MVEISKELMIYMRAFQKEFGDIVPLRELPASVTTDELIETIKLSIEKKTNLLPMKFGYDKLDKNPNIII